VPRDAQVVAALATDPNHGQGAAAGSLLSRFLGADVAINAADQRIKQALGLPQSDRLGPLMGNDLVAARTTKGTLVAWVAKDEQQLHRVAAHITRYRAVTRGSLLLAGTPAAVQQALTQRGGMTRQLFNSRLRGLPSDALLRAEGSGSVPRLPLPITSFALTVRADDNGLHARLRGAVTATSADDLPLAPGATPPAPLGRTNGATVGIRDLRHAIRYALRRLQTTDRSAFRRYELARRGLKLIRRGDIDHDVIDQLSGDATIWSPDLKTFTITAPVADPGRMARALSGLGPLIRQILGQAGLPGARYGVTGNTFIATTDPTTAFARLAAGRPQRIDKLTGALTGIVRGQALGQALIDRLGLPAIASLSLSTLGDTTFAVRTATTGVEASADLTIRK
jgi:hypothetical protein